MLLNFVQMGMVILVFTPGDIGNNIAPPQYSLGVFPLWYTFELANRARIFGKHNTKGYMHSLFACPERPRYALMHKVDASLSAVSLLCTFLRLLGLDCFRFRLLDLLANASMWRIFVLHPSLRNILFVCSQGVAPLRMLLGLAAIVYYYFCLIFHEMCHGKATNHNFLTLRDTMITMYQVLVGIYLPCTGFAGCN